MSYSGTFTAVGNVSSVLNLGRDDSATVTLTNTGGHAWSVVLEESVGGQAWKPLQTFRANQSGTVVTPALQRALQVRLRLATLVDPTDTIAFTLAAVVTTAGLTVTVVDGIPRLVLP